PVVPSSRPRMASAFAFTSSYRERSRTFFMWSMSTWVKSGRMLLLKLIGPIRVTPLRGSSIKFCFDNEASSATPNLRHKEANQLLRQVFTAASQNLVDGVDGAFGSPITDRHGKKAVQECVLGVTSVKAGRGPEIVGGGVDALTAGERSDYFRRPVTKPERRHVNQCAIVRFECKAQVELEDAICPEEGPVTATG